MSNLLAKSIYLPNFSSPNAQNNKFAKVSPAKPSRYTVYTYVGWNKNERRKLLYCVLQCVSLVKIATCSKFNSTLYLYVCTYTRVNTKIRWPLAFLKKYCGWQIIGSEIYLQSFTSCKYGIRTLQWIWVPWIWMEWMSSVM